MPDKQRFAYVHALADEPYLRGTGKAITCAKRMDMKKYNMKRGNWK